MIPLCIKCRYRFTKNISDKDFVFIHGHIVYPNIFCTSPNNVHRDFVSGNEISPLCSQMNDRGQCASWKSLPQMPDFSTEGKKLTLTAPNGDKIYWALKTGLDGEPQFHEYTDPIPLEETMEFFVYTETLPFKGLDGAEKVIKSETFIIECSPSDTDIDGGEEHNSTEDTPESVGE